MWLSQNIPRPRHFGKRISYLHKEVTNLPHMQMIPTEELSLIHWELGAPEPYVWDALYSTSGQSRKNTPILVAEVPLLWGTGFSTTKKINSLPWLEGEKTLTETHRISVVSMMGLSGSNWCPEKSIWKEAQFMQSGPSLGDSTYSVHSRMHLS